MDAEDVIAVYTDIY